MTNSAFLSGEAAERESRQLILLISVSNLLLCSRFKSSFDIYKESTKYYEILGKNKFIFFIRRVLGVAVVIALVPIVSTGNICTNEWKRR